MLNTITNFHHSSNYILKGTTRFLPNAISSKSILASNNDKSTKQPSNHPLQNQFSTDTFPLLPSFRQKASCRKTTSRPVVLLALAIYIGPFFYIRIVHFWLDESRMKGTHSIPLAHLRWSPTLRWNDT